MSGRLQKIIKANWEREKESPYNFCDRWCERCTYEKQTRCRLYQDELERDMICIAHGKDPGDPEITEAVMRRQLRDIDEKLDEAIDKYGTDLDNLDIDEDCLNEEDAVELEDLPPEVQKHIKFVENNHLKKTAEQYRSKAQGFLEKTFYKDDFNRHEFKYEFETVSWYHALLSAKINRALAGFHEPMTEDDFALYDAVAQLQVCKKAIRESTRGLRVLRQHYPAHKKPIFELIALLNNICNRIELLENTI